MPRRAWATCEPQGSGRLSERIGYKAIGTLMNLLKSIFVSVYMTAAIHRGTAGAPAHSVKPGGGKLGSSFIA
jgi:hypothetical protein